MLEDPPPPPPAQLSPSLTARDGMRFLNMHVEGNANQDSRDTCNILYLAAVMTGWSWVIPRALTCCLNEFIIFQDIGVSGTQDILKILSVGVEGSCLSRRAGCIQLSQRVFSVTQGWRRPLSSPPHPSSLLALFILSTGTTEISHVIGLPQARPALSSGVEFVWVGVCSWGFGKIKWDFKVYFVSSVYRNQHVISQRL